MIQKDKSGTLGTSNDQYLFEPLVYDARGNGDGETVCTLTGDHQNRITDYTAVAVEPTLCIAHGQDHADILEDVCPTLSCNYEQPITCAQYKVRRLTPVECERLQGYPDGYTDIGPWIDDKGKLHKEASDTARYKALGNSIALPQWKWLLERMRPYLPEEPTMASLFDGLGGFPLCWNAVFGEGLVEWASEVEPFCIAVTNKRINGIEPDARLTGE